MAQCGSQNILYSLERHSIRSTLTNELLSDNETNRKNATFGMQALQASNMSSTHPYSLSLRHAWCLLFIHEKSLPPSSPPFLFARRYHLISCPERKDPLSFSSAFIKYKQFHTFCRLPSDPPSISLRRSTPDFANFSALPRLAILPIVLRRRNV